MRFNHLKNLFQVFSMYKSLSNLTISLKKCIRRGWPCKIEVESLKMRFKNFDKQKIFTYFKEFQSAKSGKMHLNWSEMYFICAAKLTDWINFHWKAHFDHWFNTFYDFLAIKQSIIILKIYLTRYMPSQYFDSWKIFVLWISRSRCDKNILILILWFISVLGVEKITFEWLNFY